MQLTDDGRVVVLGADHADGSNSSSTASDSGSDSDSGIDMVGDSTVDNGSNSDNNRKQTVLEVAQSTSTSDSHGSTDSTDSRSSHRVPVVGAGITGLRWFFKPGPAHLDTLEFSIVSDASSSPDVFLRYTGFIDRYVRANYFSCVFCFRFCKLVFSLFVCLLESFFFIVHSHPTLFLSFSSLLSSIMRVISPLPTSPSLTAGSASRVASRATPSA